MNKRAKENKAKKPKGENAKKNPRTAHSLLHTADSPDRFLKVFVTGRKPEALEAIAKEINAPFLVSDLTKDGQCQRTVDAAGKPITKGRGRERWREGGEEERGEGGEQNHTYTQPFTHTDTY